VLDDRNRVVDAVPEDDSYTHTIIEMFMVEGNEAVARLLSSQNRAFLRRIHPDPDPEGSKTLSTFVRACGYKLPAHLSKRDMQDMLASVKGKPESYAINLALLKTFEQAEYSPMQIGHFALASDQYCHFTSPIRRYPDLTVHRLFAEYCRGTLASRPPEDMSALVQLGAACTAAERRAKAAEDELREVLILQFLTGKVGESFDGVITGVANFGIFVQSPRFLIEGLIRMDDLGDDWWEVNTKLGQVTGQRSGRRYRIGDMMPVRIADVNVARRQLNLVPERQMNKTDNRPRARKERQPQQEQPPSQGQRQQGQPQQGRPQQGQHQKNRPPKHQRPKQQPPKHQAPKKPPQAKTGNRPPAHPPQGKPGMPGEPGKPSQGGRRNRGRRRRRGR
jgi:ribonuclease R